MALVGLLDAGSDFRGREKSDGSDIYGRLTGEIGEVLPMERRLTKRGQL